MRVFCLIGVMVTNGVAAPPDVKYLYPAGASRGETVQVNVGGELGSRPVSVWCDRDGVNVSVDETKPELTVTVAADAIPGTYWLRLHNAEGASSLRPFVVGTLPNLVEKEPNNALPEAIKLTSSQVVVNGRLEKSGDTDTVAVPLQAGQTLVASLEANALGSPMDGVLQVLSGEGFVREQNDDAHGMDPQIVFAAPSDGTYFVRVFSFPEVPNSSIRLAAGNDFVYRLTLTTGPFVDHTRPLAVPRSGDQSVQLIGWNIPDSLAALPLTVPDSADSVAVWHPDLANALTLPVLDAAVSTEQDADPQPLALPGSVTGRIESPGDIDVYSFTAKKGDRLQAELAARGLGQELDPVLRLLDSAGKQVARVDDAARDQFDANMERTIPQDGEYLWEVSDLFGHGGQRHTYRLTVTRIEPDFTLSVQANAFVLKAGTPLKIPVTLTRLGGLAEMIEISVDGLPAGISAAAVTSRPKDKSEKTVELVLTADKPVSIDRPFRIRGKAKVGEVEREHLATAPVSIATTTTRELWLTVRKP